MPHTTSLPKIAGYISIFIGVLSAAFSFVTNSPEAAMYLGGGAVIACLISGVIARKNIDELQMAVAGLFLSIVGCAVGAWQVYNF